MYMESTKHNTEYLLVDSLSFKLPGSGQYVVDRRNCKFHTEGGNSDSASNGTRVLTLRMNGEGWLDPSTVRIMLDVLNADGDSAKTLKPKGYRHGFFHRLRLSVRGQIIEDVQDFDRVSHSLNMFENPQTRFNDNCSGFVYFDDIIHLYEAVEIPGIKAGLCQTVMFKPL